jgi:16S rRNA (guanine527-N7)-methyltransferase
MMEADAKVWLREALDVSPETMERLDAFRARVVEESALQNLISAASIPHIWVRHIADSAQLLSLINGEEENWLDLGTGAGFPGIVVALLSERPITFVESRRKRIEFLESVAEELELGHVTVFGGRLESMKPVPYSVISARAFAPLPKLLSLAHSFSTKETLWLLPKGRGARDEVDGIKSGWKGMFHVKQSLTDAESSIIVASQVETRK